MSRVCQVLYCDLPGRDPLAPHTDREVTPVWKVLINSAVSLIPPSTAYADRISDLFGSGVFGTERHQSLEVTQAPHPGGKLKEYGTIKRMTEKRLRTRTQEFGACRGGHWTCPA